MKLRGTRTWIIGASSGIGAALARELDRRGARVAISARRAEQLHGVAAGRMLVLPLDVTDEPAVVAAAERVRTEFGAIDLVIVAAGYWRQMHPQEWDTRTFNRHLEVNLGGMNNAINAVVPTMLRRGAGVFAGVASVAGYRGLPGAEAYGATKAAQIYLLESLRAHVARSGVHVTTICPGFVRTDLTAGNRFPMPFMVEPADAARAICTGLERDRPVIVFPLPMSLLMKASRFVPTRMWSSLFGRAAA
jgi:short-subunit dehydrogenase